MLGHHAINAVLTINPERAVALWVNLNPHNASQATVVEHAQQLGLPIHPLEKQALAKRVDSECSADEECHRTERKEPCARKIDCSGRYLSSGRTRVHCVNSPIDDAVESHSSRSGCDHAEQQQEHCFESEVDHSGRDRYHDGYRSKRKSKDAVRELDHPSKRTDLREESGTGGQIGGVDHGAR